MIIDINNKENLPLKFMVIGNEVLEIIKEIKNLNSFKKL